MKNFIKVQQVFYVTFDNNRGYAQYETRYQPELFLSVKSIYKLVRSYDVLVKPSDSPGGELKIVTDIQCATLEGYETVTVIGTPEEIDQKISEALA